MRGYNNKLQEKQQGDIYPYKDEGGKNSTHNPTCSPVFIVIIGFSLPLLPFGAAGSHRRPAAGIIIATPEHAAGCATDPRRCNNTTLYFTEGTPKKMLNGSTSINFLQLCGVSVARE